MIDLAGREFVVIRRVDISQARGLVHARHALIMDYNFEFDRPDLAATPQWRYALRFTEGDRQVVLTFDPDANVAGLFPIGHWQGLRAATLKAEVALIEREFYATKK